MKNRELFAVSKNGEFFGYADEEQIKNNPKLSIYQEPKPQQEAPKTVSKGIDPSQIRRKPGRPKKG